MTSWIINNTNPPKAKKREPRPPMNTDDPFAFDRRETNPIGDEYYLTPPEYGVDTHESWD